MAEHAGSKVLVCVTGGIAAYKACTLVSRLAQAGVEVTVAMTPAACKFVQPLTFQALSARPVYTSAWDHIENHDPQHIALAKSIDCAIVAPCSMDAMAKLAAGMADDIVSLILSAVDRAKTPVILAPSMNEVMWSQPATQRNLKVLREDGYRIAEPAAGWQACRAVGPGRMQEAEELVGVVMEVLGKRG